MADDQNDLKITLTPDTKVIPIDGVDELQERFGEAIEYGAPSLFAEKTTDDKTTINFDFTYDEEGNLVTVDPESITVDPTSEEEEIREQIMDTFRKPFEDLKRTQEDLFRAFAIPEQYLGIGNAFDPTPPDSVAFDSKDELLDPAAIKPSTDRPTGFLPPTRPADPPPAYFGPPQRFITEADLEYLHNEVQEAIGEFFDRFKYEIMQWLGNENIDVRALAAPFLDRLRSSLADLITNGIIEQPQLSDVKVAFAEYSYDGRSEVKFAFTYRLDNFPVYSRKGEKTYFFLVTVPLQSSPRTTRRPSEDEYGPPPNIQWMNARQSIAIKIPKPSFSKEEEEVMEAVKQSFKKPAKKEEKPARRSIVQAKRFRKIKKGDA